MTLGVIDNVLSPPILFFLLGALASLLKSDLEIPKQAARFLSIYLLFAIGLHGGHELGASSLDTSVFLVLLVAVGSSILVPVWSFFVLRVFVSAADSAAIAATYGSVSAVTFVTAIGFLQEANVEYGGHLVAAMALMESPAIVVGILLARFFDRGETPSGTRWSEIGREAFLNGPVLLLLGSLGIGLVMSDAQWASLEPFAADPFKGVLCLFLLDMGLVAAKRLGDLRRSSLPLISFGVLAAVAHAMLAIGISKLIGLERGDALLLAVLMGSASYIAVPAAVRLAIPKANPGLYVPMSLAVTFPFNVVVGIPLYDAVIRMLWSIP
ncbi:MAG: sodium-dependent bicarbonate transport family permease [Phycisphaerales bacterium]|nr:sodium-dependent bicarbonate transport family permease [Phycisphaerales bacterium]